MHFSILITCIYHLVETKTCFIGKIIYIRRKLLGKKAGDLTQPVHTRKQTVSGRLGHRVAQISDTQASFHVFTFFAALKEATIQMKR